MELLRNIFTLCMALIVSIPLCICGSTDLPDTEIKDYSCHSHCHSDSTDSDKEEPHCDSAEHKDLQFILPDAEAPFLAFGLDSFDDDTSLQELFPIVVSFNFERTSRPPPDIGRQVSTRRLYDIFSSYRL